MIYNIIRVKYYGYKLITIFSIKYNLFIFIYLNVGTDISINNENFIKGPAFWNYQTKYLYFFKIIDNILLWPLRLSSLTLSPLPLVYSWIFEDSTCDKLSFNMFIKINKKDDLRNHWVLFINWVKNLQKCNIDVNRFDPNFYRTVGIQTQTLRNNFWTRVASKLKN